MTKPNLAIVRTGDNAPAGEVEPAGVVGELDVRTLNAVTALLGQIERTTRAARPVIVHSAPAAVAEPARASGPEPIDVHIPPAATRPAASEPVLVARLFTRAEVFYYCGASLLGFGGLGFALAHFGANLAGSIPVLGGFCVLVSAIVIVAQDGRYNGAGDHRGRVKSRGGRR